MESRNGYSLISNIGRKIGRFGAVGLIGLMPALSAYALDSDGDRLDDSVETNTGTYVSPSQAVP